MIDRYSGDPKIVITQNGADMVYRGGQPEMDQGLENCALIPLFTRESWVGNVFLPEKNRIGSDFEKTSRGTITLTKIADIENSAIRALSRVKAFCSVTATVRNQTSDNISVEAKIGSGSSLSLKREAALWSAQINNPASRRIK